MTPQQVLQMLQTVFWQRAAHISTLLKASAPCCGNNAECLEHSGKDLISHAHKMSERLKTCKAHMMPTEQTA